MSGTFLPITSPITALDTFNICVADQRWIQSNSINDQHKSILIWFPAKVLDEDIYLVSEM